MAAATVLWTVRYPEHAGDVMVPAADVPLLAWIAAGGAKHPLNTPYTLPKHSLNTP